MKLAPRSEHEEENALEMARRALQELESHEPRTCDSLLLRTWTSARDAVLLWRVLLYALHSLRHSEEIEVETARRRCPS